MTPREVESDEPPEDEDEWYYSLGRQSAEKQDAPFANWSIVILLGGLALVLLPTLSAFAIGGVGAGVFGLIIVFILLLIFPILLPFFVAVFSIVIPSLLLAAGVMASSLLQLFRQISKPK